MPPTHGGHVALASFALASLSVGGLVTYYAIDRSGRGWVGEDPEPTPFLPGILSPEATATVTVTVTRTVTAPTLATCASTSSSPTASPPAPSPAPWQGHMPEWLVQILRLAFLTFLISLGFRTFFPNYVGVWHRYRAHCEAQQLIELEGWWSDVADATAGIDALVDWKKPIFNLEQPALPPPTGATTDSSVPEASSSSPLAADPESPLRSTAFAPRFEAPPGLTGCTLRNWRKYHNSK